MNVCLMIIGISVIVFSIIIYALIQLEKFTSVWAGVLFYISIYGGFTILAIGIFLKGRPSDKILSTKQEIVVDGLKKNVYFFKPDDTKIEDIIDCNATSNDNFGNYFVNEDNNQVYYVESDNFKPLLSTNEKYQYYVEGEIK